MGMDIVFFTPRGIDMESERISGKTLRRGAWKQAETRIPDVIDISAYCMPRPSNGYSEDLGALLSFLLDRSYLTFYVEPGTIICLAKDRLPSLLVENEEFASLALGDVRLETFDDLARFLAREKKIVVKPVYSSLGIGVHAIEYDDANSVYEVELEHGLWKMGAEEFRAYAEEHFF